jgi:hypothetical protein
MAISFDKSQTIPSTPPLKEYRMNIGRDYFRTKKPLAPVQKNFGRTSTIESHGPDGKVRGNAQQLIDRYTLLGKDAMRESDVVLAESYFQHAEHYRRLLATMRRTEAIAEANKPVSRSEESQSPAEESIILAPPVAREEFFDGPIDAQDAFLED